ncbi:hypothetical protein SAMN04488078_102950 [Antarctobacter heliothermus]|uniref:Uncharacterized protein n=1 Tax=Antarctobacter heliothermus TaxID=74033 RepID=A0A239GXH3_9RHOB|nr:hypothetical protein SAMN04488078_102950 [Antarctobacter heliothermus]
MTGSYDTANNSSTYQAEINHSPGTRLYCWIAIGTAGRATITEDVVLQYLQNHIANPTDASR